MNRRTVVAVVAAAALFGGVGWAVADTTSTTCTPNADGSCSADITVTVPASAIPTNTVTSTAPAPPAQTVTSTVTVTAPPTTSAPTTTTAPPTTTPSTTAPAGSCASTVKDDADGPDPWGGCFPGPSTTGPTGTLTAYTGPSTITTANTVIQNAKISGTITVAAAGVTIKNSQVSGGLDVSGFAKKNAALTVSHVSVNCGNTGGTTGIEIDSDAADPATLTVDHANITACENGFDADQNATITESYIHDLFQSSQAHTDGIQSAGGGNINLTHNVFYGDTGSVGGTSAINIDNYNGGNPVNSIEQHNLVAGGAYTVYCPVPKSTNFQVVNNRFSWKFNNPKVGEYGPDSDCAGEIWSGNTYPDGSAVVVS